MLTPKAQTFADAYGPTADLVAVGTGFDRWALLVQWDVETTTGDEVYGNNPGNIEESLGVFAKYANLEEFANAAISVWHQTTVPEFEPWRAASVGAPMFTQLLNIGNSPWDAGRYGKIECGYAGCSLVERWTVNYGRVGGLIRMIRVVGPDGKQYLLSGSLLTWIPDQSDAGALQNTGIPLVTVSQAFVDNLLAAAKARDASGTGTKTFQGTIE